MTGDVAEIAGRLDQAMRDLALPGVVSVYFFGSEAEGRAHRES
jgi:hypothetical protein